MTNILNENASFASWRFNQKHY